MKMGGIVPLQQSCDNRLLSKICVDGKTMAEEGYIKSHGTVPLKNNRTVPPWFL